MSEDSINIAEKSESIKHDIDDCYRSAIKYLELYNNALMRRVGNHKLYYSYFVSKFQSLYYFTRVDGDMQQEKIELVDENVKSENIIIEEGKKYELLLSAVDRWFNDAKTDPEKGIKLFLQYANVLYKTQIFSF